MKRIIFSICVMLVALTSSAQFKNSSLIAFFHRCSGEQARGVGHYMEITCRKEKTDCDLRRTIEKIPETFGGFGDFSYFCREKR